MNRVLINNVYIDLPAITDDPEAFAGMLRRSETRETEDRVQPVTVSSLIRIACREQNLTNRSLAVLVGVSATATAKWINGRGNPQKDHLRKVAEVLKLDYRQCRKLAGQDPAPVAWNGSDRRWDSSDYGDGAQMTDTPKWKTEQEGAG